MSAAGPSMRIIGPDLKERTQCAEVLRSLPMWFGIEDALLMYADDSVRLPGFAAVRGNQVQGFILLTQHFPHAWEVHCMAVRSEARNKGYGKALMAQLARRCVEQGLARFEWSVLDWNAPSIAFYQSIGAAVMDDWKICRLSGPALHAFAAEGARA